MKHAKTWMWLFLVPALIAGCAPDNAPKTWKTSGQPLVLTAGMRVSTEGVLDYGTVVFAENPTTLLEAGDFHGYEFDGKAGGVVTITMKSNATNCGALDTMDTVLDLFGPEDANGNLGAELIENDDASLSPCSLDSQIKNFNLPVSGTYLIVATSFLQQGGGHYRLQLTCENNACVLPGSPTFASTRINQADIDRGLFTPAALFEIGDFMFETVYRIEDGMGNSLKRLPANNQPRPSFRPFPNNVHFAEFGAPEAQSCVSCHNVGGYGGAGDLNHNIFQIGDGINRASGVPRNPSVLLGGGLRQRIGEEMTAELQAQLAAGKAQAAAPPKVNVTVALRSKNTNFGSVVAKPDGSVDFTLLDPGIDSDLVVKPFGWKGREALLRSFIEDSFRVHFGMQAQPSLLEHCPNVNMFGNGPSCFDPDADGVTDEITDGQLSAEAVYMGLRETPVRVPAVSTAAQTRVNQGEVLFNQVGCQGCHRQNMTINVPVHVEPADTTGGAGITLHLATDTMDPHPAVNADGSMTVELWSDFKRHDMGAALADSKPFNQIAANQFITPPLWGIADSAPYLHDGRAPTLNDAILLHGGGDATNSINAFKARSADDQSKILEFLGTLGRAEDRDVVNATPVDLSGFTLEQSSSLIDGFFPAGTIVPHGSFVVVARNATRAQFEAFYGKTLGSNVSFFSGGNALPIIDGSETFALFDSQGMSIDGRSIAEPTTAGQTLARTNCGAAAPLATSWKVATSSSTAATPGTGPLSTGLRRICISEIADATNSSFEYVEIFVE